jgi:hypothetical protein
MQKAIQKNWRIGGINPKLHSKISFNGSQRNGEIYLLIMVKKHDE